MVNILCLAPVLVATMLGGCSRPTPVIGKTVSATPLPQSWLQNNEEPFLFFRPVDERQPSSAFLVLAVDGKDSDWRSLETVLSRGKATAGLPSGLVVRSPAGLRVTPSGSVDAEIEPTEYFSYSTQVVDKNNFRFPPESRKLKMVQFDQTERIDRSTPPSIGGRRLDSGFPAYKALRISPSQKYIAIAWTNESIRRGSLLPGNVFSVEDFPGEEYIQLFDPATCEPLGPALHLQGRKNSGEPYIAWLGDEGPIVVYDRRGFIWVLSVADLIAK